MKNKETTATMAISNLDFLQTARTASTDLLFLVETAFYCKPIPYHSTLQTKSNKGHIMYTEVMWILPFASGKLYLILKYSCRLFKDWS